MGLVNTDWLRKNLLSDNIKILDCSWHMPNSERSGKLEFEACHIPGSIFFDIDEFSDKKSSFPHTVLPDDKFSQMISDLGISNQDHIVVYDTLGIFSSPRVWWMFNYYGHNQISILDGGLIKWCKEKNISMAVCTNKQEHLSNDLLKKIGIYDFFEYVAGSDTFDYCKPDPRHLTSVVEILDGDVKKTIMIGDSETDANAAKAAEIPVILLENGYTEKNTTEIYHNHLIKDFIGIEKIISKYL
jgi:3-deoxy-D-manno-octulosonate 8-phosphate phosphatase KdsC-like HAD superfamily phosphatase